MSEEKCNSSCNKKDKDTGQIIEKCPDRTKDMVVKYYNSLRDLVFECYRQEPIEEESSSSSEGGLMIKIRRSIFETNSSSTHSITIEDNYGSIYNYQLPSTDGIVYVECNYYGFDLDPKFFPNAKFIPRWGVPKELMGVLVTPYDKLCYAVTAIQYKIKIPQEDDRYGICVERMLINSKYFKWLKELVKEKTGLDMQLAWDTYDSIGTIDHQSENMLMKQYFSSNKVIFKRNMEKLIFSSNYGIIITSDNW